jgi:hypothetical protein
VAGTRRPIRQPTGEVRRRLRHGFVSSSIRAEEVKPKPTTARPRKRECLPRRRRPRLPHSKQQRSTHIIPSLAPSAQSHRIARPRRHRVPERDRRGEGGQGGESGGYRERKETASRGEISIVSPPPAVAVAAEALTWFGSSRRPARSLRRI